MSLDDEDELWSDGGKVRKENSLTLHQKKAKRLRTDSHDMLNPKANLVVCWADPLVEVLRYSDDEDALLTRFALDTVYTKLAFEMNRKQRLATAHGSALTLGSQESLRASAEVKDHIAQQTYALSTAGRPMRLVGIVKGDVDETNTNKSPFKLHRPKRATEYDLQMLTNVRNSLLGSSGLQTVLSIFSLVVCFLASFAHMIPKLSETSVQMDKHCQTAPVEWREWFLVQTLFSVCTIVANLLLFRGLKSVYNRHVLRAEVYASTGQPERAAAEREKGQARAQGGMRLMHRIGYFGIFLTVFGVSWFILALYMSVESSRHLQKCSKGIIWFWLVFSIQVSLGLLNMFRHSTMRRGDLKIKEQEMRQRMSTVGGAIHNKMWN